MNWPLHLWDDMPDIPACPHCGHKGEGLQWAFPDNVAVGTTGYYLTVMCSCLACGAHGPARASYARAIEDFAAGKVAEAA